MFGDAFDALKHSLPMLGPFGSAQSSVDSAVQNSSKLTADNLTGDLGKVAQWAIGGIGNVLFVVVGLLLIAAAIFYFVSSNKTVQEVVKTAAVAAA